MTVLYVLTVYVKSIKQSYNSSFNHDHEIGSYFRTSLVFSVVAELYFYFSNFLINPLNFESEMYDLFNINDIYK